MKILRHTIVVLFVMLIFSADAMGSDDYAALSLRNAQRAFLNGRDYEYQTSGGITRFIGIIRDPENDDLILLGRREFNVPEVEFDHIILAARGRLIYDESPYLSLDATSTTSVDGMLNVNMSRFTKSTVVHRDLFNADVKLKRLSLSTQILYGIGTPYCKRLANNISASLTGTGMRVINQTWHDGSKRTFRKVKAENRVEQMQRWGTARLWFTPGPEPPIVRIDRGVILLKALGIDVCAEVQGEDNRIAAAASDFATAARNRIEDVAGNSPEIMKLKAIFDLNELFYHVAPETVPADLYSFIRDYPIRNYPYTPMKYPASSLVGELGINDGSTQFVQISGGINVSASARRVFEGDLKALRKLVIESRQDPYSVTWEITDLSLWPAPPNSSISGQRDPSAGRQALIKFLKRVPGTPLVSQIVELAPVGTPLPAGGNTFSQIDSPWKPGGVYVAPLALEVNFHFDSSLEELKGSIMTRPPN